MQERLASEAKTNEALRADIEKRIKEERVAHERELSDAKAQLNIERESWEDMFMRKQESVLKAKVCRHAAVCRRLERDGLRLMRRCLPRPVGGHHSRGAARGARQGD